MVFGQDRKDNFKNVTREIMLLKRNQQKLDVFVLMKIKSKRDWQKSSTKFHFLLLTNVNLGFIGLMFGGPWWLCLFFFKPIISVSPVVGVSLRLALRNYLEITASS